MKIKIVFVCMCSFVLFTSCSFIKKNILRQPEITKFSVDGKMAQIDEKKREITFSSRNFGMHIKPEIEVSNGGTVEPKSGEVINCVKPVEYWVKKGKKKPIKYTFYVDSSIKSFFIGKKKYELIALNKTWLEAAKFAKERGGYLAQIDSEEEQKGIYNAVMAYEIDASKTVAPDGGGASYLWLGGNDLVEEGRWIWDGNHSGNGIHFWTGKVDGKAINGRYTNWGQEPDDYLENQDALGLAITDWPLGKSSQWNDIAKTNLLYFIIEYD